MWIIDFYLWDPSSTGDLNITRATTQNATFNSVKFIIGIEMMESGDFYILDQGYILEVYHQYDQTPSKLAIPFNDNFTQFNILGSNFAECALLALNSIYTLQYDVYFDDKIVGDRYSLAFPGVPTNVLVLSNFIVFLVQTKTGSYLQIHKKGDPTQVYHIKELAEQPPYTMFSLEGNMFFLSTTSNYYVFNLYNPKIIFQNNTCSPINITIQSGDTSIQREFDCFKVNSGDYNVHSIQGNPKLSLNMNTSSDLFINNLANGPCLNASAQGNNFNYSVSIPIQKLQTNLSLPKGDAAFIGMSLSNNSLLRVFHQLTNGLVLTEYDCLLDNSGLNCRRNASVYLSETVNNVFTNWYQYDTIITQQSANTSKLYITAKNNISNITTPSSVFSSCRSFYQSTENLLSNILYCTFDGGVNGVSLSNLQSTSETFSSLGSQRVLTHPEFPSIRFIGTNTSIVVYIAPDFATSNGLLKNISIDYCKAFDIFVGNLNLILVCTDGSGIIAQYDLTNLHSISRTKTYETFNATLLFKPNTYAFSLTTNLLYALGSIQNSSSIMIFNTSATGNANLQHILKISYTTFCKLSVVGYNSTTDLLIVVTNDETLFYLINPFTKISINQDIQFNEAQNYLAQTNISLSVGNSFANSSSITQNLELNQFNSQRSPESTSLISKSSIQLQSSGTDYTFYEQDNFQGPIFSLSFSLDNSTENSCFKVINRTSLVNSFNYNVVQLQVQNNILYALNLSSILITPITPQLTFQGAQYSIKLNKTGISRCYNMVVGENNIVIFCKDTKFTQLFLYYLNPADNSTCIGPSPGYLSGSKLSIQGDYLFAFHPHSTMFLTVYQINYTSLDCVSILESFSLSQLNIFTYEQVIDMDVRSISNTSNSFLVVLLFPQSGPKYVVWNSNTRSFQTGNWSFDLTILGTDEYLFTIGGSQFKNLRILNISTQTNGSRFAVSLTSTGANSYIIQINTDSSFNALSCFMKNRLLQYYPYNTVALKSSNQYAAISAIKGSNSGTFLFLYNLSHVSQNSIFDTFIQIPVSNAADNVDFFVTDGNLSGEGALYVYDYTSKFLASYRIAASYQFSFNVSKLFSESVTVTAVNDYYSSRAQLSIKNYVSYLWVYISIAVAFVVLGTIAIIVHRKRSAKRAQLKTLLESIDDPNSVVPRKNVGNLKKSLADIEGESSYLKLEN